jgi:hypothetical protein
MGWRNRFLGPLNVYIFGFIGISNNAIVGGGGGGDRRGVKRFIFFVRDWVEEKLTLSSTIMSFTLFAVSSIFYYTVYTVFMNGEFEI